MFLRFFSGSKPSMLADHLGPLYTGILLFMGLYPEIAEFGRWNLIIQMVV